MADDPNQPKKDLDIVLTELQSAISSLTEKVDRLQGGGGGGTPFCYVALCTPCQPPYHHVLCWQSGPSPCVIFCAPCYQCAPCAQCGAMPYCVPCAAPQCVPCTAQCVTCVQCVQCQSGPVQCAQCGTFRCVTCASGVCCTPCTNCVQCTPCAGS